MEKGTLLTLAMALFTLVTPATKAQGNLVELHEAGNKEDNCESTGNIYKNDGDKTYLTSHGLVGSVGYRVFKKTNVKFRYAHSVGSPDLSYSMYELGLFGVESLPVSMGCGIRYIDSMTEGIRNYCSVFLAFKI